MYNLFKMDISSMTNVVVVLATNLIFFLCEVDGSKKCLIRDYDLIKRHPKYVWAQCKWGCCGLSSGHVHCCYGKPRASFGSRGWLVFGICIAVGFCITVVCIILRRRVCARGQQRSQASQRSSRQRPVSRPGSLQTENENPVCSSPHRSSVPTVQLHYEQWRVNSMTNMALATEFGDRRTGNANPECNSLTERPVSTDDSLPNYEQLNPGSLSALDSELGVQQTINTNPACSGQTGSPGLIDQLLPSYEQLDAGSLSPPSYETIMNMAANAPPKYDSIYRT